MYFDAGKEEAGESWPKNQLFYMKQTIGNACGTIGLLHIICNTAKPSGTDTEQGDKENANKDWNEVVPLAQEGFLNTFTRETKNMSPEERGSYLENPPNEAVSIDSIHEVSLDSMQCICHFIHFYIPTVEQIGLSFFFFGF